MDLPAMREILVGRRKDPTTRFSLNFHGHDLKRKGSLDKMSTAETKRPNERPEHATLVALVPSRLTAPTRKKKLPSDVIGPDHELVARQASEWQQLATHAVFWEMGGAAQGAEEGRVYSLVGQMAAVGEQLGLARAAYIEVALWRWVRAKHQEEDPLHEMSMRAMAESQCLFVIGAGHGLANVGLYALALDSGLRAELGREFGRGKSRPTFAPFSGDKADWVSMNAFTAKRLARVASKAKSPEVGELIKPVADFGRSTVWSDLTSRRGEDFHQWRLQSHGLAGVSKASPWQREGKTRVLGIGTHGYADARDLAETTGDTATKAMFGLARAMESFLKGWIQASEALGGPKFNRS